MIGWILQFLTTHWKWVLLLLAAAFVIWRIVLAAMRRQEKKAARQKREFLQNREGFATLEDLQSGMDALHTREPLPTHRPQPHRPQPQETADSAGELASLQSGKQALKEKNLLDDDVFIPDESAVSRKFMSVVPTQAFADGQSLAEGANPRRAPQTDAEDAAGSVREKILQHKQEIDPQAKI